jgi:hypothetical protein
MKHEIDFEKYDYLKQTYHFNRYDVTGNYINNDLEMLRVRGWVDFEYEYLGNWLSEITGCIYWFYRPKSYLRGFKKKKVE